MENHPPFSVLAVIALAPLGRSAVLVDPRGLALLLSESSIFVLTRCWFFRPLAQDHF